MNGHIDIQMESRSSRQTFLNHFRFKTKTKKEEGEGEEEGITFIPPNKVNIIMQGQGKRELSSFYVTSRWNQEVKSN